MRLTANEREQRDEEAFRKQVQREVDAEQDGRDVGRVGGHAGLMPDYPSSRERDAWLRGWQDAMRQRRVA